METIKLWPAPESAGTGNPQDDFEPYLEAYPLNGSPTPLGAVIVCPGGGYSRRAPHEAEPIARKFNEMGFHAFVLHYRVSPYRFPAPQRDVFRAVKIVRGRAADWGVNPEQIAVLGFSAGGHLTACAGTLFHEIDASAGDRFDAVSQRPDAVAPCYAVIELRERWGHRGSAENLFGELVDSPETYRYCLQNRVMPDSPPAFLWHTAEDQAVDVRNSVIYAEACWRAGVPAELHVFPRGQHGLGLAEEFADVRGWPAMCAEFLKTTCGFRAAPADCK